MDCEAEQRRKLLYGYLLARGDRWTPMRRVTEALAYPKGEARNYHDSKARRILTKDIKEINNSTEYQKVIISGNGGIKLANPKEFERFLEAEYGEVFRKLKQIRRIGKKGLKDQQMDIESRVYSTFID